MRGRTIKSIMVPSEIYDFTIAGSKERIPFSYQIRLFRELNLKVTRITRDKILK